MNTIVARIDGPAAAPQQTRADFARAWPWPPARAILMAMLALACILSGAFGAQAGVNEPLVSLSDAKAGSLLLRADDSGHYVEALRAGTDVKISVSGPTLRTTVTQMFRNPGRDWAEGVYVYPLDEGAAVDTMKMVIGQHVIVADIKEKQRAKLVYERAKAQGRHAALVEQERPNMFMNAVANIGPGDTVVVQIEYQAPVHQADNRFSFRVPLVVAPRYSPGVGSADTVSMQGGKGWGALSSDAGNGDVTKAPVLDPRENGPANPVSIHVDLDAGFPIAEVTSSFHKVVVTTSGPDRRHVELANGAVPTDRDFELVWRPKPDRAPSVGLFHERVGVDEYLLAYITPPATDPGQASPRDVTFVIDNSGSMGGASIEQAKDSLGYALSRLRPADRFNVIRFDSGMTNLFGTPVPATAGNLGTARNYVDGLQAEGGTVMVPPMLAALNDSDPGDTARLRQVVFITDGGIDNEQQFFDAIVSHRGRSRLFMVGIGSAPNSYLMTRAAELGGGAFVQIGSTEQVKDRMKQLIDKLESPAMTNIDAHLPAGLADVTPRILPDLYHGETLVLAARLKALAGTAKIHGMIEGTSWSVTLPLDRAAEGRGISKLWARRKIDDTEVALTLNQITREQADDRVLDLALEHHLVTRLTSLVAVDRTPARPRGVELSRSNIPLNLPAGWDFDKVFGTRGDLSGHSGQRQALFDGEGESGPIDPAASVLLPQTATDAGLRLFGGAFLIVLSLALTILMRRRIPA